MRLVIWSMMMVDAAGSVAGDAASMMVMTMMRLVMWIMIGPSGNALTATGRPPSPTTPRPPGTRGRQGGGKERQAQGEPKAGRAPPQPQATRPAPGDGGEEGEAKQALTLKPRR